MKIKISKERLEELKTVKNKLLLLEYGQLIYVSKFETVEENNKIYLISIGKRMIGKYINNKIEYVTPRYNMLTGGNWKEGWSGIRSTGGEIIYYEIDNYMHLQLEENKRYEFEIVNSKARIIKKAR